MPVSLLIGSVLLAASRAACLLALPNQTHVCFDETTSRRELQQISLLVCTHSGCKAKADLFSRGKQNTFSSAIGEAFL